jgi:RNA polymerase sigma factor (sigma-70 family)
MVIESNRHPGEAGWDRSSFSAARPPVHTWTGSAPSNGLSDEQLLERFVAQQDAGAFEVLIRRHGPMVLGICRRLLHDEHAAEDAFQATFLVLVSRARSVGKPELLANWLYGVAYRIAGKARAAAARRRLWEEGHTPEPAADFFHEVACRDLRAFLAAELNSLPEKYRAPLILCYWEGKTNEEAARQLGCPAGSMSWRLARGREMLRQRLTGRLPRPFWG